MPADFYKYRFVVTGGGTGGHIMPLLAVAEALKAEYLVDLLYIGSRGGREERLAKANDIKFKGIFTGKWRRYYTFSSIVENLIDIVKLKIGFFQALFILLGFRPRAILAKGGYVSLPVVIAGWILRIPILAHESDAVMGVTNKISRRMVKRVATGFPVEYYLREDRDALIYTGVPVQKEFYKNKPAETDYTYFHFNKRLPVLLITGGIQGANRINEAAKQILPKVLEHWQVVHLAGDKDYPAMAQCKEELKEHQERYALFPVLGNERVGALRMADVVVSRASATTLAEIALMGKATILIPLATAAGNHQVKNAEIWEKAGAALVIQEEQLTGEKLYERIESLRESKDKRSGLEKETAKQARPEAARMVMEELFKLV